MYSAVTTGVWILTASSAHAVGITSVGEFVLKTMKE
jgi:hypothetical protein